MAVPFHREGRALSRYADDCAKRKDERDENETMVLSREERRRCVQTRRREIGVRSREPSFAAATTEPLRAPRSSYSDDQSL